MKTAFAVLAGGLAIAGCSNAPEPAGYPISVDEAYARLKASDLSDLLYHRRCGVPIKGASGGVPGKEVYWQVMSGGEERLRFTVTLTPVDAQHTKARVTIAAREHDGEGYDGSHHYKRPVLEQPIRPAVEEQVAAILESRDYDKERAGRGDDSVCDVQRAGSESGSARFSVNERGPDTVRDSARRDERWSTAPSPKPGEPDPNAGKPSVRTW